MSNFSRVAALLWAVPIAGFTASYSISGYLIDAVTNAPLGQTPIGLFANSDVAGPVGSRGYAQSPAPSDSGGHFSFLGLRAGCYVLQAQLPDRVVLYEEDGSFPPYSVCVGPGSEERTIFFRVTQRATIRGVGRGRFGETPNLAVSAYRRQRRGGRFEYYRAGGAQFDQDGRYVIQGLRPGDYIVCADTYPMRPFYFAPSNVGTVEYRQGGQTLVYVPSCFPSQGALHVAAGSEQSVDFVLRSATSVTVRPNMNVTLLAADHPGHLLVRASDTWEKEDRFRIFDVPPGRYTLYNITGDGRGFAVNPGETWSKDITVSSEPLSAEIVPMKRGKIEVHIYAPDGRALPDSAAQVTMRAAVARNLIDLYMIPNHDWTFDPGEYAVAVNPIAPHCVASQLFDGHEAKGNGKVTVTPAMRARLDILLSTDCGSVDVETVANGAPAPFAAFLLLISGTPADPGQVVTGTTDSRGHATIPRLSAGRYTIWAWNPGPDDSVGPDLAASYAQSVEVTVVPGRTSTAVATPMPPGGGWR